MKPLTIAAIAEGRRPEFMPEDEATAWDFLTELHAHRSVSDTTYARALRQFNETGLIDLIALAGYYSLLGMVMNTARTPASDAHVPKLPTLP